MVKVELIAGISGGLPLVNVTLLFLREDPKVHKNYSQPLLFYFLSPFSPSRPSFRDVPIHSGVPTFFLPRPKPQEKFELQK